MRARQHIAEYDSYAAIKRERMQQLSEPVLIYLAVVSGDGNKFALGAANPNIQSYRNSFCSSSDIANPRVTHQWS
jgi:hypothetical protein